MAREKISIWYFIGLLILIYGVLILGAGIVDLMSPTPANVVMADLHAGIWWGALLVVTGSVYVYFFHPGKRRS
jgi:hypothetical protein